MIVEKFVKFQIAERYKTSDIYAILLILLVLISPVSAYAQTNINDVKDLPLVLTESKVKGADAVALIISGDGGWYHFEQLIADKLADQGIYTIGLDARKYFWQRQTPEKTALQMAQAMDFFSNKWGTKKFIVVGYSLGAEIIPFLVNRFPDSLKKRIYSAVLLSPATTTDFEIHITNMMGIGNKNNTYETIGEIKGMSHIHTLIIFGEGEKTTVPDLLTGTPVIIKKIPGDHHYKSNVPLIIQTMSENKAL